MRAHRSPVYRSIPFLLVGTLAPGCSTGDSGTPLSPEDPASAISGALELTIREVGTRPDADGYTVAITLAGQDEPLLQDLDPGGGSLTLADLPLGTHKLEFEGLATPCSITGSHPRTFVIMAGEITQLEMFVSCPGPGAIVVKTVTRGSTVGLAGYAVSILGDAAEELEFPLGANDSLLVGEEELPAGEHWFVKVTGVPDNCWMDLPPARGVGALKGATVRLEYAVVCLPRGSQIAFELEGDIYLTTGSGTVSLPVPFLGVRLGPSLAPDRRRVVFSRFNDNVVLNLYLADADGGGGTWLTSELLAGFVGPQAWSPDGTRIAFWKHGGDDSDIYVINADGSGEVRLTHGNAWNSFPAWSPDGTSIAFCRGSTEDESTDIYRMSALDGSGLVRVVEDACHPAWSPDGSRIAFTRWDPFDLPDLAIVDADGSGLTRLHPSGMSSADTSVSPIWSPDGSLIAFVGGSTSNRIWMVEFDGTSFGEPFRFRFGTAPSWR